MFHLPALPSDYYECMAAIGFAILLGKLLHSETRVLTAALIGAVLTGSYSGVVGGVFMCFLFKMGDYINLGD